MSTFFIKTAEDAEGKFIARNGSGKFLKAYIVASYGVHWIFCSDYHKALIFNEIELDALKVLLDALEDHPLSFHPVSEFLSEVL